MFVNNTTENVTVKVDLAAKAPQLANLPEDLFDVDASLALGTFAALCCSANVKDGDNYLVSVQTLALRNLALFAAGAQVYYNRADFRDLERDARGCANNANHELVSWVLKAAYNRAKSLGIVGPGTADTYRVDDARTSGFAFIEPMDGRGYGKLAEDLSADLFLDSKPGRALSGEEIVWQHLFEQMSPQVVAAERAEWSRKRLFTYAAVMSALKPRLCNTEVEAVVLLALYGAGCRIDLSNHQFDMLRMRAESYIGRMEAARYADSRNRKMTEFALAAATQRALDAGISR